MRSPHVVEGTGRVVKASQDLTNALAPAAANSVPEEVQIETPKARTRERWQPPPAGVPAIFGQLFLALQKSSWELLPGRKNVR